MTPLTSETERSKGIVKFLFERFCKNAKIADKRLNNHMRFRNWIENHELNGEYWITDSGSTMYADGDIGDYNHEAYVIMYIQGEIANSLGVDVETEFIDWDNVKSLIVQEILDDEDEEAREELQHLIDDGEEDEIILRKMKESDPDADEKMSIANGYGDAREYAIMKWGWKRVVGNEIESRSLNADDMKAIASGISEIDEMISDDAVFSISVYGNQHYDVTLAELEAGRLNAQEPEEEDSISAQSNITQNMIQNRRQQQKAMEIQNDMASKQVRDADIKNMHPYYQNKTFPIGDCNLNSFQKWMNHRLEE